MTDEFIAGIGDAQGTLCPHALGAGNNTLAGQYVQIGILVFLIASLPILAFWCFFIDRAILWYGLSPHVAKIGLEWTRIAALHFLIAGVSESVVGLLEISDHEAWVAIVDIVFGLLDAAATALTVTTWKVTLSTVAWIHLASEVIFFIFVVVAATSKGWYRQFYKGLIGTWAFKVRVDIIFSTYYNCCFLDCSSYYCMWTLLPFSAHYRYVFVCSSMTNVFFFLHGRMFLQ
jgi:Na+-driven multidrug efflux pump